AAQSIAVLEAERAEERIRADAKETNTGDLVALLLRHDPRGAHELRLVLEDRVDHGALDAELRLANLVDLLRDLLHKLALLLGPARVCGRSGRRGRSRGARRRFRRRFAAYAHLAAAAGAAQPDAVPHVPAVIEPALFGAEIADEEHGVA